MLKALIVSAGLLFAVSPGSRLPGFVLRDVEGKVVYRSDLCGRRHSGALIVDFFATWCKPCQRAIRVMKRIRSRFSEEELKILLIAFRQKPQEIVGFFKKKNLKVPFPVLYDPYGEVSSRFGVNSLPRTFVVDAGSCEVKYVIYGERSDLAELLEREIKKILKKGENK